jgi:hypothetical protein
MNPRDNEREFGAMVRRGLASGAAAAESEHLDAEVLAAYFERTLTAEELRACDLHVSNCAQCRSEMAALARAEPEIAGAGSRRFSWIWDWRFLVPVTAALAMFVAWATVWGPFGPRNGRVATPVVAQNQPPSATSPLAPLPIPSSTETVEVSPQPPSTATKDSKGGAAVRGKNVDAVNAPTGRPTDEESRNARREFKKERDRGASDSVGGGTGGGVGPSEGGSGTAGGIAKPPQSEAAKGAAPAPPAAPNSSDATIAVNAGEVPKNPAPVPGAEPSKPAAPGQNSNGPATASTQQKAAPGRAATGSRGAAMTGTAGGIAAQKSAAPAVAETVTSRFKQDESTPIIIPTPDSNILWRVAGAHEIQLSRDVGATWQAQLTETSVRLVTGSAPSSKICWVVGRQGTILRTVDGEKWETVKSPTELDITSVSAQDADVATITASDGRIYETKNGGAKWKHIKKPH